MDDRLWHYIEKAAEAGIKPMNEYTQKHSDVYFAIMSYCNRRNIPNNEFRTGRENVEIELQILERYALQHMVPIQKTMYRVESYHKCNANGQRIAYIKSLKKGYYFNFQKLSWWTTDLLYLNEQEKANANLQLEGEPWFFIYALDGGQAADLSDFLYGEQYIIPEMDFVILEKQDYPILRKTFLQLKQRYNTGGRQLN